MSTTQWFPSLTAKWISPLQARAVQLFTFFALTSALAWCQTASPAVVGYYAGWNSGTTTLRSLYKSGAASQLTHLIYAFADVDGSGNCLLNNVDGSQAGALTQTFNSSTSVDGSNDPGTQGALAGNFNQLRELKNQLALQGIQLKVLISVGGQTYSGPGSGGAQGTFSQAAAHYQNFASTCISTFIKGDFSAYGISGLHPGIFDGFDIDWEYPTGNNSDTANYNLLLNAFKTQMATYSQQNNLPPFTLTAAIGPLDQDNGWAHIDFNGSVQSPGAASSVDFFNVMAYGYQDGTVTTFNAPLYFTSLYSNWTSIDTNIQSLTALVPANKLSLGIPFYGIQWTGVASAGAHNGLYQSGASGSATAINYSAITGSAQYCDFDGSDDKCSQPPSTSGADEVWQYSGSTFTLFDDPRSVGAKGSYALAKGLRGIMAWDLSMDSSNGSLLCAMGNALAGKSPTAVCNPPANNAEVQITLASSPAGATFSISGNNCPNGFYSAPMTLSWNSTSSCAVTANPPTGYTFSGWADGPTSNPRTLTAASTATYTADFTASSGNCTFSLSATSGHFSSSAASGSVNVTTQTGCAWVTTGNIPAWITVVSGSGTGSGTVQFQLSANSSSPSRTATLTIAGQAYTINQDGTSVTPPTALRFIPMTPCRVVDTRNPNGSLAGPYISAGSTRSFPIQNACGIPNTALAYSLNVTVVPMAGTLSYLTVWPSNQSQPVVSTLNSYDGRIKANAAIVPAGVAGGPISVFATDNTNVILDINGYFVPATNPNALAFYSLPPCRILDTRSAKTPIGAGQSMNFAVQGGACNVPATAQAYSLNFTAIPAAKLSYLTTWPTMQTMPLASTLNDPTGAIVANAAIVPAGYLGDVSAYATDDTDLVVDIDGYFAPAGGTQPLSLYTLTPCRVLDTRNASGSFNGTLAVNVEGSGCGVPAAARAYAINATVVPPAPLLYLTLWPNGQTQPVVSTLNANDGAVTSNMAIVPTSNGLINAFSSSSTQLILDISSYFAP